MSNVIYEDKYHNEDLKRDFLEIHKEGTQKIFQRMFKVSRLIESELGKDLYDFNLEELRRLFFMYKPKTEASSNSNVTLIGKYIDWCIDEGHLKDINPLDMVSTEWKRQFVNRQVKSFWTDKELDEIIDSRHNASDAVIIELLRNGVRGIANSEITLLTKNAVDAFNNQLHLIDDEGNKRTIIVSDKCIKLCEQAIRESEYEKMNGNTSSNIKSPMAQLVDNEFVVRLAKTRVKSEHSEADKNVVHRRLKKIADEIGEPNFAATLNIARSGMLAMAKDRYLLNGELTDVDVIEIAIQFGEDKDSGVYRLKNDFLNVETIKQVYSLT
ncbi:phage lytic cycle repressor MrpR family protein [Paenibacillus xylaniclasticus]|uniref:phage lytic cycle repressor MrpR family protein n=1 Tax=Paenibacillus xylaniclasticus TaxID=588083 RepID=UPI000FD7AC8B|nr:MULTISPECIES: integrase [Paenibacillus]GFN32508.1 hypothetical protein PCURB6_27680 [Paenibacillus curdlanolyticus]